MDDGGMCVSAEADPANLAGSPVLLEHFHTAPFSQRPIELLHGVDTMHRENVDVVHLCASARMCAVATPNQTHREKDCYCCEGHFRGRG